MNLDKEASYIFLSEIFRCIEREAKHKYSCQRVWILGRLAELGEHWSHSVEDLGWNGQKSFCSESIGYLTGLLSLDLQYLELGSLPHSIERLPI